MAGISEFVVFVRDPGFNDRRLKSFDGPLKKARADAINYAKTSAKFGNFRPGASLVVATDGGEEVGAYPFKPLRGTQAKGGATPAGGRLPELFSRLTADDWRRIRARAESLEKGDEEAVMLSIGYLDIGRLDGGFRYIGAMSFDADGRGGLEYRRVMQNAWR